MLDGLYGKLWFMFRQHDIASITAPAVLEAPKVRTVDPADYAGPPSAQTAGSFGGSAADDRLSGQQLEWMQLLKAFRHEQHQVVNLCYQIINSPVLTEKYILGTMDEAGQLSYTKQKAV